MSQRNIFRNIGERPASKQTCYMTVEIGVTVEWPEGIPYDEEVCKEIAENATHESWDADVGTPGHIIWANCYSECTGDAIVVESCEEKD